MLPVNPLFYDNKQKQLLVKTCSPDTTKKIEQTDAFTVPEKVNIVALLLGHKWITDIAIDTVDRMDGAQLLLKELGLPFSKNYYTYENETHEWVQVAANQAILDYIMERRNELTVIEAGVLYGYPVSHTLGYVGLVEKEWKDEKNIAEFFLSGVYSKAYSERETKYFEAVWKDIIQASPGIGQLANDFYDQSSRK